MKSFDEWKEANLDEQMASLTSKERVNVGGVYKGKQKGMPGRPVEAPAEEPEEPAETDPHAALEKGDIATYLKLVQRAAGAKGLYNPQTVAALKKAIASDSAGMTNFLKVLGNMKVGQQARLAKGVAKI